MSRVTSLAHTYDVALLDLDGVVYVGAEPVAHAPESLRAARAAGMHLAFVTNNAARTPESVAGHLTSIGVDALPDEVVTSAQAAARVLDELLPAGARVLVVGGDGLVAALAERGLTPVASADADPAAVVQGFAPDVSWRLLAEGSYAVAAGLPWVASNIDRTIPTARGRAPGNGALVDAVRAATGREPVVAGKPEPPMHRETVLRTGAQHPLVVGDRLDTDIEGANRAGVDSLLVFTGVTDPAELISAPPLLRPTFVGLDLRALAAEPEALRVVPGIAQRGRWLAEAEAGVIRLTPSPDDSDRDRLDALRALCGLAWDPGVEAIDRAGAERALESAGW